MSLLRPQVTVSQEFKFPSAVTVNVRFDNQQLLFVAREIVKLLREPTRKRKVKTDNLTKAQAIAQFSASDLVRSKKGISPTPHE